DRDGRDQTLELRLVHAAKAEALRLQQVERVFANPLALAELDHRWCAREDLAQPPQIGAVGVGRLEAGWELEQRAGEFVRLFERVERAHELLRRRTGIAVALVRDLARRFHCEAKA